jgi:hypothetical protein
MNEDTKAAPQGTQLFASRNEFQQALRDAFAEVARHGGRELWLCDRDFVDWPLGERPVIESLTQWAYAHRKLVVLGATFDEVVRRHARWLEWRVQWSHIVECRTVHEDEAPEMPSLLYAPDCIGVRRLDVQLHRGRVYRQGADLARCREWVDAIAQRSIEAFPVTTLGL